MATKTIDYPTLSNELENILSKLQTGDIDIDEAVALYERGTKIAKELEQYLKTAENSVNKLKISFEDKQ